MEDPLIDVGISYVHELFPTLDAPTIHYLRGVFSSFLSGAVSYHDAQRYFSEMIGSSNPIDRLQDVLAIMDQPAPSRPLCDDGGSDGARKKTRTWTAAEDLRLLAAVHKYGLDSWSVVAQFVGNGRSRSQCSQRWIRVLDPKISKEQWTPQEDERLVRLVSTHGEKAWMKIAVELGNRSDVQCRYHYMQLQKDGIDKTISANIAAADDEKAMVMQFNNSPQVKVQNVQYNNNLIQVQQLSAPLNSMIPQQTQNYQLSQQIQPQQNIQQFGQIQQQILQQRLSQSCLQVPNINNASLQLNTNMPQIQQVNLQQIPNQQFTQQVTQTFNQQLPQIIQNQTMISYPAQEITQQVLTAPSQTILAQQAIQPQMTQIQQNGTQMQMTSAPLQQTQQFIQPQQPQIQTIPFPQMMTQQQQQQILPTQQPGVAFSQTLNMQQPSQIQQTITTQRSSPMQLQPNTPSPLISTPNQFLPTSQSQSQPQDQDQIQLNSTTENDKPSENIDTNEETPIPLSTSLDLRKSETIFDSNLWLLRVD